MDLIEFQQYHKFLITALSSSLGAALAIMIFTRVSKSLNLVDVPNGRKQHSKAVPAVGGLSIYLVLTTAFILSDTPEKLSWLIFSSSFVVATGAIDDAYGLSVKLRLACQFIATTVMLFGSSLFIRSIGLDFWGLNNIDAWIGIPISFICIIGLTNAFNMADGIDGLASGHMLVSLTSICAVLYLVHGEILHVEEMLYLFSSILIFWLINLSLTPLVQVFLGDAGSLLLGFVLGWILIYYSQPPIALMNPVIILWCVTLPVFDTISVLARRWKDNKPMFCGDRIHLHHLLLDLDLGPKITLTILLGSAAAINAIGIWLTIVSPLLGFFMYILALVFYVGGSMYIGKILQKKMASR